MKKSVRGACVFVNVKEFVQKNATCFFIMADHGDDKAKKTKAKKAKTPATEAKKPTAKSAGDDGVADGAGKAGLRGDSASGGASSVAAEVIHGIFDKIANAKAKRKCSACGKSCPPESFDDDLSRKEYTQSGLCQEHQDAVFGKPQ